MRRETWVGLAWAGALVAAMVGVFLYGLSTYEPERFGVRWEEHPEETTVAGDVLAVGATRSHDLMVAGANVTRVVVTLEWADAVGPGNDRMALTVTGPAGAEARGEGALGAVVLTFPLAPAPTATAASGANAEHALEGLERAPDPWRGAAPWNLTVRLVDAPGTSGTQGLGLDAQPDGANDYTLRFVRVTTDAVLTPRA